MTTETEKQVYTLRGLRIFVALFWALVLVFAFTQGGIGAVFAVVVATVCGIAYVVLSMSIQGVKGNIIIKPTDEGDA